jgi:hypothetical protein
MAFCLSGGNPSGRKEKIMEWEKQKYFTPVPWDNMPRQPDPKIHPAYARRKKSASRGPADFAFSIGQVFHPLQPTSSAAEEEK